MYTKHFKQKLPITLDEAWHFFSDTQNLQIITPEDLDFIIISGAERSMFAGQIIQYTITPLFGIKLKWVTEITHVCEKEFFVDEQRFGPYTFWHHKHFFRETEGGIEMEDIVDYKLPFGILGKLAHRYLVQSKIEKIFEYRQKKLISLFGKCY